MTIIVINVHTVGINQQVTTRESVINQLQPSMKCN